MRWGAAVYQVSLTVTNYAKVDQSKICKMIADHAGKVVLTTGYDFIEADDLVFSHISDFHRLYDQIVTMADISYLNMQRSSSTAKLGQVQ